MTNRFKQIKRDGCDNDRLFFSLLEKKGLHVLRREFINDRVQLVYTKQGIKIMKGFETREDLLFQWDFCRFGKEKGNEQIVHYEFFPDGSRSIAYGGRFWGLMPFLPGTCLNFTNIRDQQQACSSLQRFHDTYQGFFHDTTNRRWRLIPQWSKRIRRFHCLMDCFPCHDRSLFKDVLYWGYYALSMLAYEPVDVMEKEAERKKTWIHGDVAPHNFVRLARDDIRVVDFDLVAMAPTDYDFLQLANRILVCNGWDLHGLCVSIPQFEDMLNQRWFLLSLIYPSDLFREWNQFYFGRSDVNRLTLLEYSEKQFVLRFSAVRELIHMIY